MKSPIVSQVMAAIAIMGMTAAVGILTYLAGTFASAAHISATPVLVSAAPPLPGTPVVRYVGLDPAIVAYLDSGLPDYGAAALQVSGAKLPPIGAFLPRTGNTSFALPTATLPAALAVDPTRPAPSGTPSAPLYPTSPPLPAIIIPTVQPGTPTPDLVATVQAFAASVPYGQYPGSLDNCAPSGRPVEGVLTQYYHWRHSGMDQAVPMGSPVYATHSGIITWAGWNTFGYGNLVIIQSGAFITYYAHLTSPNASVGDFVSRNSIIGWSGSTGNSSGPHVHYETRINDVPVDPLTFEERGYGTC